MLGRWDRRLTCNSARPTLTLVNIWQGYHGDPSSKQLLLRLEKDILWLQRRGLWTRSLFEKAVLRYVEARGSAEGLDEFSERHKVTATPSGSWLPR